MKFAFFHALFIGTALLLGIAFSQELTHTTFDSAGGRSVGGTITNDATLGTIGGEMYDSAPLVVRSGFVGQLWDPVSLSITPQSASMQENSILQLSASVLGDDGIVQPLSASLTWETASVFLGVDAAGLFVSTSLPSNQVASVIARSGELTGHAEILLLDVTADDFGDFAGDGLDDAWQWMWFAGDPTQGQPGDDGDGDGQDNAFEFLAGTTPIDGTSFLQTWIASEPNQPTVKQLFFKPWIAGRNYVWEWSSDLQQPWQQVEGDPVEPEPSGAARATDDMAIEARKFYRLQIALPAP